MRKSFNKSTRPEAPHDTSVGCCWSCCCDAHTRPKLSVIHSSRYVPLLFWISHPLPKYHATKHFGMQIFHTIKAEMLHFARQITWRQTSFHQTQTELFSSDNLFLDCAHWCYAFWSLRIVLEIRCQKKNACFLLSNTVKLILPLLGPLISLRHTLSHSLVVTFFL